jgi:hypothetical protein
MIEESPQVDKGSQQPVVGQFEFLTYCGTNWELKLTHYTPARSKLSV